LEFLKKCVPNVFLAGIKEQKDKAGGRILLGDNTGVGHVAADQFPLTFIWTPMNGPTHEHFIINMRTQFRIAPDLP
jgi:hypothetical protein